MPSNPPRVDEAMVERAISVFADHGIDFRAPWQCDLDDLERERFDALVAAITAALGETHVVVERADLKLACEIAARTETAPEVARLIAASLARLIAASQNEGG